MTKRLALVALAILMVAGTVAAQTRDATGSPIGRSRATMPTLGTGTIQFDNDTPVSRDGTDGGTVGNRFSPAGTYSVASVSFAAAGNFATSMVMTVWDIGGASANVAQRQLVSGIPQTPATASRFAFVLTAPVIGQTNSVIAGLRNTDYDPCIGNTGLGTTCDGVALTGGTGPIVPSRAARINFTSGSFVPTITIVASTGSSIPSVNSIFRITGDNIPVELIGFDVD